MYFYESHLGGIFTSKTKIKDRDLYCDQCGDYDSLIGEYDSWTDFITKLNKDTYDFFCLNVDYLCEEAKITKEEFKKLNPIIYEYDKEIYCYEEVSSL